MFTGIIEEIGTIKDIRKGSDSAVLTIACGTVLLNTQPGDSIAVNGICLTVTRLTQTTFCADVMHETLDRTALRLLRRGSCVNLERAIMMGGRFNGHIVSGHIDGTGTVNAIRRDDNAVIYTIGADSGILNGIVEKGSVAIDGISLTVTEVTDRDFSVSIIPHTFTNTTLSLRKVGDPVNLETDIIGKYVARVLSTGTAAAAAENAGKEIDFNFLAANGFL